MAEEVSEAAAAEREIGQIEASQPAGSNIETVRQSILDNMSDSTRRSFDRYSGQFEKFCEDEDSLLRWVIALRTGVRPRAVSTLWVVISLVRKYLRYWKSCEVTNWKIIAEYMKGEGKHEHPKQSTIISRDVLLGYFKTGKNDGENMVRKLAVAFQYFGALRREEVCLLEFGDVERNKGGVLFRVRRSKTDQAGVGAVFEIPLVGGCGLVELFDLYKSLVPGPTNESRLFRRWRVDHFTEEPIGKNTVARFSRLTAEECGLRGDDLERFTSHGIRASAATAMADGGMSVENLMRAGRWRSSSVAQRYVRDSSIVRSDMARVLGERSQVVGDSGVLGGDGSVSGCGAVVPRNPRHGFTNCTFRNCVFTMESALQPRCADTMLSTPQNSVLLGPTSNGGECEMESETNAKLKGVAPPPATMDVKSEGEGKAEKGNESAVHTGRIKHFIGLVK